MEKHLIYIREWLIDNEVQISEALKADLGKHAFESYETEIMPVLSEIAFLLKRIKKIHKPKRVRTPLMHFPSSSRIVREPYGRVLVIAPWNYPFQLALVPLVSALACGNVVILKPSEEAPHVSSLLKEMFSSSLFDTSVSVFEGGREVSTALLDERFDKIFFTGSSSVGKIVMTKAAANLTPIILELGGKSPCIVDESADLALAARRIAWGKFLNAGQTCIAPDTVYVHRSIKEVFLKLLVLEIEAQWSYDMASIVNLKHRDRLLEYCDEETLIVGEDDFTRNYLAPRLVDKEISDEIFGPILPVIAYDDVDVLIDQLKSLPKPLAFYLFTTTNKSIMNRMSYGGGVINDTLIHFANRHLPFGGVGNSGMGSYHGQAGIDAFTHQKSIMEKSNGVDIKVRYAPYKKKLKYLKFFTK